MNRNFRNKFHLLGYKSMESVRSRVLLHAGFLVGYFFTLKIEATYSSEILGGFKQTT
jgi:hypothetical protein